MRSSRLTHARAADLRRAASPPEVILWLRLRERRPGKPTFRRQHPIGPYIADFYCAAARLVIEVDGAGHGDEAQQRHDRRRDLYMERLGCQVIRVSAADVMNDADEIAQGMLDRAASAPSVTRRERAARHLPRERAGEE